MNMDQYEILLKLGEQVKQLELRVAQLELKPSTDKETWFPLAFDVLDYPRCPEVQCSNFTGI